MTGIAIDRLLDPVSEAEPAGPNLEETDASYNAAFNAAKSEVHWDGTKEVRSKEPDWPLVEELSTGILTRSKDLRVAVLLTRALSRVQGLAGLAAGLALIQGLLERHWDHLYPQLDPDDANDPTARVNCLLDLCDREILDYLRTEPLVRSKILGPLNYRDIEIAEGRASAPAGTKALDAAAVKGVFQDCDLEELKASATAVNSALERARGILETLAREIRTDQLPRLDPLTKLLGGMDKALQAQVAERLPKDAGSAESGTGETAANQGAIRVPPLAPLGQIASRDDVVRAIDRICDYYSRYEPSSPVPLLLMRARRLATGSFLDIVRDLAPGALSEIEKVCGPKTEP